jgi:hypothetical protein
LFPVQGSDTNWYSNLLADPTLNISVNGVESSARGKPITDSEEVNDIARSSRFKIPRSKRKTIIVGDQTTLIKNKFLARSIDTITMKDGFFIWRNSIS